MAFFLNPFMYNVWPFYNIMHERVKGFFRWRLCICWVKGIFYFFVALRFVDGWISAVINNANVQSKISLVLFRSSRLEVFCKKGILRNFFPESPATLLKKRLWNRRFPANFLKFLRTPFLTEHLRWLLVIIAVAEEYWGAAYLFVMLCSSWFCNSNK